MTNYSRIGQIIGLFISSSAIPYTYGYANKLQIKQELIVIILFIIFLFLIKVIEGIVVCLIERSTFIQKRIHGKNYIDGIWFDKTRRGDSQSYGVVSIETEKDGFVIVGREYDQNVRLICDWQSRVCSFDGTRLDYLYVARWTDKDKVQESFGYTSLTMLRLRSNHSPKTYTGYFVDTYGGLTKVNLQGQRMPQKEAKSLDNIAGIEDSLRRWINNVTS